MAMTVNDLLNPPSASTDPDAGLDEAMILKAVRACRQEAEDARRTRDQKTDANIQAFLGVQDFSHKQKGQSREFLPKQAIAIEQFSAFVKRALVGFGEWYRPEVPPGPLDGSQIRRLMDCHLRDCGPAGESLESLVSDGVKVGALGALMIFKVHSRIVRDRGYKVAKGLEETTLSSGALAPIVTEDLVIGQTRKWKLLVELVRPQDYYPDPTGRWLYEIHEAERDLSDVIAWADEGIYDKAVVSQIVEDYAKQEDVAERARQANQDVTNAPGFRKRVCLQEYWGDLLDDSGNVLAKNIVCTIANDRYVIRPPEPNPNWHGRSPFIKIPLLRVPFSVWHKALADHLTDLNLALNELYNLMVDGGLAAVWGVRQLHTSWLEDPDEVSNGIPQGFTLRVNEQCPPGAKAMETVTTGEVPREAGQMFEATIREFLSAAMTNELRVGGLPSKQVKATEIMAASESSSVMLDGIARDVEEGLTSLLELAWWTILQHAPQMTGDEVVAAMGLRGAIALGRMSEAQRFLSYHGCGFRVFGLTAILSRQREFQKLAALLSLTMTNPLMLQSFTQRYSIDRVLDFVMKTLNIDPINLRPDDREQAMLPDRLKQLPFFQSLTQDKTATGGAGLSAQNVGEAGMPAEIAQMANPMTGLAGGGG